jgi:hypothetical protein
MFRKSDVLLRRQALITEEYDAVLAECVADLGQRRIRQCYIEFNTSDLGADGLG